MSKYSYFTHPNSVCMSYFKHMKLSLGFSKTYLIGSYKALIHAFFPNVYITSTSDINEQIKKELNESGCLKD